MIYAMDTPKGDGIFETKCVVFTAAMSVEEFRKHYWYISELRQICREHGLDTAGTKAVLGARIERFLSGGIIFSDNEEGDIRFDMSDSALGPVVEPGTPSYLKLSTKVIESFKFDDA
jgi:hypothetical protein